MASVASARASSSIWNPEFAIVSRRESRTSSRGMASSSSGLARRKKVTDLPLRISSTPVVIPAKTSAMFWFSRIMNCTAVAISRMSSLEASWTSSIVTRRPLPRFVMPRVAHSRIDSKSSRLADPRLASIDTRGDCALNTISLKRDFLMSLRLREARRSPLPETLTTSQPSSSAIEASSESSTVLPEPRGPVMRIRRPGAPSPLARPSRKSSVTFSRPTSTGGILPAVGLNGF